MSVWRSARTSGAGRLVERGDAPGGRRRVASGEGDGQLGDAQRGTLGDAQRGSGGVGTAAARQGASAGEHVGKGAGLDQVVVGADVKAADSVFHGVARGEDEHGDGGIGATEVAQHFEAIAAGQHEVDEHEVDEHEVEATLVEETEGFLAAIREGDFVLIGREAWVEGVREGPAWRAWANLIASSMARM